MPSMTIDLSDVKNWNAYFGGVRADSGALVAEHDQARGRCRIVSRRAFAPPLEFRGWIQPIKRLDRPGAGANTDGVHIHVGHLSNEANLTVSLTRVDDLAVAKREWDEREYDILPAIDGGDAYRPSPFRRGHRYTFAVAWFADRILVELDGAQLLDVNIPMQVDGEPISRPTSGQVGFRLDRVAARMGALVVIEGQGVERPRTDYTPPASGE